MPPAAYNLGRRGAWRALNEVNTLDTDFPLPPAAFVSSPGSPRDRKCRRRHIFLDCREASGVETNFSLYMLYIALFAKKLEI